MRNAPPPPAVANTEGRFANWVGAAWLCSLREQRVEQRVAAADTEGTGEGEIQGTGEALAVLLRVAVQRARVHL